jgi:prepilin-type N-terminal cleavage/methylation domain-containing protein
MKSEKGFTLLEMLLVLVIFSSILTIALPGIRRIEAYWQLQSVTQRIVADLRESQAFAMAHSDYHEIRFAIFDPLYAVYEGVTRVRSVEYPKGIFYPYGYLQLPYNHVRFDGAGHVTTSGTIPLVNAYGDRTTIVIYMHTGRVAVTGVAKK